MPAEGEEEQGHIVAAAFAGAAAHGSECQDGSLSTLMACTEGMPKSEMFLGGIQGSRRSLQVHLQNEPPPQF